MNLGGFFNRFSALNPLRVAGEGSGVQGLRLPSTTKTTFVLGFP